MSHESARRSSNIFSAGPGALQDNEDGDAIPRPPPLPNSKPLQRAKNAAYRIIGYQSRPPSPQDERLNDRFAQIGIRRHATLTSVQNATLTHRTGLEINTLSINEKGTHALLGGKEIFKSLKIEDGVCVEDRNLRMSIRSTPTHASGRPRQNYSIDIADVAWAKGDCGDYVAAATISGKIILYDIGHAGLQAAQLHEHYRQVHKVTFNPHRGNLLLSGSQDGSVRLWDVRDIRSHASTLQSKRKFLGQTDSVRDVKWSPTDGVDFAFGTDSGWIQRWDMRNLKTAKVKIPAHSTACNSVDWHPDGKHVASAGSDKTVRVWDFSSSKRGRAHWEIKTPHAVLNARWRPPCESALPMDNGAMQCTQIVTSYDREHPTMHLWDFRRPALPFRELTPFKSATTDVLWHSQDLLWSVGREGIFQQTDMQHAPKVIDNRNIQAFGLSSQGEIALVAQKRRQHRLPPQPISMMNKNSTFSSTSSGSPDQNFLSRSWADDSLDQSFLSVSPRPPRTRTASGTKPGTDLTAPLYRQPGSQTSMVKLDDVLLNRKSFRPHQVSWQGALPGLDGAKSFKFLSSRYVMILDEGADLESVQRAFDENTQASKAAGLHRLAQTWKIVGFAVMTHLKKRMAARRERDAKKKLLFPKLPFVDQLEVMTKRIVLEMTRSATASPAASPTSMRPVSNLSQALAMPESTSNVPTPIARPVASGKVLLAPSQKSTPLLDPDKDESLVPLPPLLAPPVPNDSLTRATLGPPSPGRMLTTTNLQGLEQLQAPASGSDRIDMARKWTIQPKGPLSLDPVTGDGHNPIRPPLLKHDSDESFRFLAVSNDSTDSQGASLPASFASSDGAAADIVSAHPSRPLPLPMLDEAPISPLPQRKLMTTNGSPFAAQTSPLRQPSPQQRMAVAAPSLPTRSVRADLSNPLFANNDREVEAGGPFTLVGMLGELLSYYTVNMPNAQTAAALVTLVGQLMPRTNPLSIQATEATIAAYADAFLAAGYAPEDLPSIIESCFRQPIGAGLQPMQIEGILTTYHDRLQDSGLLNEAAELRCTAYPAYPAVYEQSLKDNTIHLRCEECHKPINTGHEQPKCENCQGPQGRCPVCWCDHSPFTKNLIKTGTLGDMLSTCLLCNHGAHAACLRVWHVDSSLGDGGCPTEGCLCDCVGGAWREEKARIAVEKSKKSRKSTGHRRVKSDEWKIVESRAAQRARASLV